MHKNYDAAYAHLEQVLTAIGDHTDDLKRGMPEPLYSKLATLERELDDLAGSATTLLEDHGHLFGPDETTFTMPAQLIVNWSRSDKAPIAIYLDVDTSWSPGYVQDDEGREYSSDDSQCDAWVRTLTNIDHADLAHLA